MTEQIAIVGEQRYYEKNNGNGEYLSLRIILVLVGGVSKFVIGRL